MKIYPYIAVRLSTSCHSRRWAIACRVTCKLAKLFSSYFSPGLCILLPRLSLNDKNFNWPSQKLSSVKVTSGCLSNCVSCYLFCPKKRREKFLMTYLLQTNNSRNVVIFKCFEGRILIFQIIKIWIRSLWIRGIILILICSVSKMLSYSYSQKSHRWDLG